MITKYFCGLAMILFFISCKKEETGNPVPETTETALALEADYDITVTTYWSAPAFTVPPSVHVTTITGMVHSADTFLWKPGIIASPGLEDVAEVGSITKLNAEIDGVLAAQKAILRFNIAPPVINSAVSKDLRFTTKYPLISFASMIAPSPDWFMGINSFSLLKGNKWIADTTVNIYCYDAGTEDGDVFGYSNPPSAPYENTFLLTPARASVLANGNASLAPIATVRFRKY